MNSKNVITAGMVWVGLTAIVSFLILMIPNHQRTTPSSLPPSHINDIKRVSTPTQPVTTKVKIGGGADGIARTQVEIVR